MREVCLSDTFRRPESIELSYMLGLGLLNPSVSFKPDLMFIFQHDLLMFQYALNI